MVHLHSVRWEGNLLKPGNFEMDLYGGKRRVHRSAEQTRFPETFGSAVVFIVIVSGGFRQNACGQPHRTQADRPTLGKAEGM